MHNAIHNTPIPTVPFVGAPCQDQKLRHTAWALAYVPGSTARLVRFAQRQQTNGGGHDANTDEKDYDWSHGGEC
jgi:hypothetical protein